MLEIHGLSKTYGAANALSGVSFSAARGKATALLGENGAGAAIWSEHAVPASIPQRHMPWPSRGRQSRQAPQGSWPRCDPDPHPVPAWTVSFSPESRQR